MSQRQCHGSYRFSFRKLTRSPEAEGRLARNTLRDFERQSWIKHRPWFCEKVRERRPVSPNEPQFVCRVPIVLILNPPVINNFECMIEAPSVTAMHGGLVKTLNLINRQTGPIRRNFLQVVEQTPMGCLKGFRLLFAESFCEVFSNQRMHVDGPSLV